MIESLPSAARHAREMVTAHVGRSAGAVQQAAAELGSKSASSATQPATAGTLDGTSVVERAVTALFAVAAKLS